MNAYNGRRTADKAVYGSAGTIEGFTDITNYMNPVDDYFVEIDAPFSGRLIQALQDLRNDQGNPGLVHRLNLLTMVRCYE
ncbi:hypothetical protein INT43_007154 [Umbelopsis isabellina]|uniref:Uncharacterized protein n=1 Tax=Mortierella isabellina TaxID=91625 RepID=A0A8H7UHT1_MORIS|nr:hypothetical protein INT43_007154 [Umbelopsis isabellina]